jgi:anti-sigma regulatory factor (Ser/Thr protein kinase)
MALARQVAQTIGRSPSQIARARQVTEACLVEHNVSEDDRAALILVVDELVTNAVRHGLGGVELYVYTSDSVVRVEVCDQGGGEPQMRPVERMGPQMGGWGLHFVDRLVDVWGTIVRPGRTVVWVQRAIAPAS